MTTPSITAHPVPINPLLNKGSPAGDAGKRGEGADGAAFSELLTREMSDELRASAGPGMEKGLVRGNASSTDAINPEAAEASEKSMKHSASAKKERGKEESDLNENLLAQPFTQIVNLPLDLLTGTMSATLRAAAATAMPEATGTVFPSDARTGKNAVPGIDKDQYGFPGAGRGHIPFDPAEIQQARGHFLTEAVSQCDEAKEGITRGTRAALDGSDIDDAIPGEANILRRVFSEMHVQGREAAGSNRAAHVQDSVAVRMDMDASQGGEKRVEFVSDSSFKGHIEKYIEKAGETGTPGETRILSVDPVYTGTVASQPGLPIPQATTPVNHLSLPHPLVGSSGWSDALSQKVLWMVTEGHQTAELSLNPPDLGPLQVVLSVDNDQASAMFVSQNADVRQALEAALPRLKEMMAESGISLGSTTVSADGSGQNGQPDGSTWGTRASTRSASGNSTDAPVIHEGNAMAVAKLGLVDTFA